MKKIVNGLNLDDTLANYRLRVAAFINRVVYDSGEVDDLTQETLLRVSKNWDKFRGDAKLSTWIFQIASNVCVDHFRSRASRPTLSGKLNLRKEVPIDDDVVKGVEQKQMNDCIHEVMDDLPESYKQVMALHDIEGIKLKVIALGEGETLSAIKVRLHRARKKFRALLENVCVFEKDKDDILLCQPKASCKG